MRVAGVGAGVGLIVSGMALGLVTAFGLLRVIPAPAIMALSAVSGLLVGGGALLVQHDVGAADWVVTLAVLGALAPVHVWVVFRPVGRPDGG